MYDKERQTTRKVFSLPKDFTYKELKTMLSGLGYEEHHLGKTSGSRVLFFNEKIGHEIKIHKPHPGNIIKPYLMKYIYENLKERIL